MVFGETAVGRGIELPMHGAAFFEAANEEVLAATARAGCCGRTTSANALVARFNPSSAVAVDLLAGRPRRIVKATPPRGLEARVDANAAKR
jgi:hypothetical protein